MCGMGQNRVKKLTVQVENGLVGQIPQDTVERIEKVNRVICENVK